MEKVKAFADESGSLMTIGVPPLPPVPSRHAPTWSAPPRAPSPPVPSALTQTAGPPASVDLAAILDELVADVAGVRAAILASVDGFGLARSSSMSDVASQPAMLAAAMGIAHQLVSIGGGDQLRQLVVDHDGGLMLVWPIGTQRVLAVLSAATVEQRRVHSFVQARASGLAGGPT